MTMRTPFLILILLSFSLSVNAELKELSPSKVCNFLSKSGLSTGTWKDNYGYECSSPYKKLGSGSSLANNIAYYVDGSSSKVEQVKLVININNASSSSFAHSELLKFSKILSTKLSGQKLPQSIANSIKYGKAGSQKINKTLIEVVRFNWPTGRGYEVKVVFK